MGTENRTTGMGPRNVGPRNEDPGNGDPGDGDPGNGDPGNGDPGNGAYRFGILKCVEMVINEWLFLRS